jgi:bile acid-coenzyme A ligase
VGRGVFTEFRILDEYGKDVPNGQVGEIYSRFGGARAAYSYRGADPLPTTDDGFSSVGDLGWIDEEGYLFLADRRTDLIISGGANIFPAEIEAVLTQHPAVMDCAVVGLSDEDLGRRVHAIMETAEPSETPDSAEMAAFCAEKLVRYKVPRSFEWVASLPRNEAGKIRRKALQEECEALLNTAP